MKNYKADLHIHTVLSPCGDLEMSPRNIVRRAKEEKIDILGITDHNSTRNCKVLEKLANDNDILVLKGAEINSKEEIHCLTFFETDDELVDFQNYLDEHLPTVMNDTKKFGYQVVVDKDDNILDQVEPLLISALDVNITEIEKKVHELNGLFIPAHIDRAMYSIISQLGFIPSDLKVDALELSKYASKNDFLSKYNYLADYAFIKSSDAHFTENIGDTHTLFQMNSKSFSEIRLALRAKEGRKVTCYE